ncbi:MAG: hypothetical protein HQL77_18660 [Magnetococcales bacterium]|nr:hypothetical protein [Magnetococcales bacterium]
MLQLEVKKPVSIGASRHGLSFCGYRLFPGCLLLSRRRKQSYIKARRYGEEAFVAGWIDAITLQSGFSNALALTAHADATRWRCEQLRRQPLAGLLCDV